MWPVDWIELLTANWQLPSILGSCYFFPNWICRIQQQKKVFLKANGRICASFLQSAPSTTAIIKIPLLIPCWCQQVHSDVSCQILAGDIIAACYVTKAMGSRKNIKLLHCWKSKFTPIFIALGINLLALVKKKSRELCLFIYECMCF